jgi:L-lactate dehydrogenase complex protein LldG
VSAREEILARVRSALADVPAGESPDDVPVPRDYRRSSGLSPERVADLFVETVRDYGATVRRVAADAVTAAVHDISVEHGIRTLVTPPGFPEQWVTGAGIVALRDGPPMSASTLDRADGVVTTAALGIAETGTIVLVSGAGMGRRALSLVPDLHVCVVRTDQLVATVPEAMDALAHHRRAPITFVSGGSATSDIELVRVEGVHGPRTLEVVLVDAPGTS